MSHHKESRSHHSQLLQDIIFIAMSHIGAMCKEINNLQEQVKKLESSDVDYLTKVNKLSQSMIDLNVILTMCNDVIHPAHDLALEWFPESKEFIETCKKNHIEAIERKLLSSKCFCYTCKVRKPV